jgi:hypothetical protein
VAPRLRRWALIVVAGALLVTWLLLPSGRSIVYGFSDREERVESQLEARQAAVSEALWRARAELEHRRQLAALGPLVRSANARGEDPVVFARDTSSLKARGRVGDQVAAYWATIPTRDPRLLTVVALDGRWNWQDRSLVSWRNDSLCVVYIQSVYWSESAVNWAVGKCGMRERFGPPGESWSRWLESTPSLRFDLTRGPYTRWAATSEEARPWFGAVRGPGERWDSWGLGTDQSRNLVSCAGGNVASCRRSFGVEGVGHSAEGGGAVTFYSSDGRFDSHAALPGTILWDLGPDRFAELWRTDTTIAAGYEQVSGKPIDGLLQRIAFAMVGPRPRDIGLSPVALVGAVCWVVLLGAWAAFRLRERRIGW